MTTTAELSMRTYPLDLDLQLRMAQARRAADVQAMADTQRVLAIRQHRLFGRLVETLRTGGVRFEEPRRMAATDKAALLRDPEVAPPGSSLARAAALARLIVDDLHVPNDRQQEMERDTILLATECLRSQAPRERAARDAS